MKKEPEAEQATPQKQPASSDRRNSGALIGGKSSNVDVSGEAEVSAPGVSIKLGGHVTKPEKPKCSIG